MGCRLTNAFWEGRECIAGKKEVRWRMLEGMVEMGDDLHKMLLYSKKIVRILCMSIFLCTFAACFV